jgi:hypothetical protein
MIGVGVGVPLAVVVAFPDVVGVADVLGKIVDVRVNKDGMTVTRPRVVVVMSVTPVEREIIGEGEGEAGGGGVAETEGDWADAGDKLVMKRISRREKSRAKRWADMATWMRKGECWTRCFPVADGAESLSVSGLK